MVSRIFCLRLTNWSSVNWVSNVQSIWRTSPISLACTDGPTKKPQQDALDTLPNSWNRSGASATGMAFKRKFQLGLVAFWKCSHNSLVFRATNWLVLAKKNLVILICFFAGIYWRFPMFLHQFKRLKRVWNVCERNVCLQHQVELVTMTKSECSLSSILTFLFKKQKNYWMIRNLCQTSHCSLILLSLLVQYFFVFHHPSS